MSDSELVKFSSADSVVPDQDDELVLENQNLPYPRASTVDLATNSGSGSCTPCSCTSSCDDGCPGPPDEDQSGAPEPSDASVRHRDRGTPDSTARENFLTCEVQVAIPCEGCTSESASSDGKVNLALCRAGEDTPCEKVTIELTKEVIELEDRTLDPNVKDKKAKKAKHEVDYGDPSNYAAYNVAPCESSTVTLECGCEEDEGEESGKLCSCTETCEPDYGDEVERFDCTLAIIKPEAMMYRAEIEEMIDQHGFTIRCRRMLKLTPEQVSDFYQDKFKRDDFGRKVLHMSSGPILVLVLAKYNAVRDWISLMGPTKVSDARIIAPDSVRGRYGRLGDDIMNAVHGSADPTSAEREIRFFFPDCLMEPILAPTECVGYLSKAVNEQLTKGLIRCCEERPEDPVSWLGNWLLENNNRGPRSLYVYLISGYNRTISLLEFFSDKFRTIYYNLNRIFDD